ncbi:MAG: hypothetical protein Q9165_006783 [Trypethelium subeluteriae]
MVEVKPEDKGLRFLQTPSTGSEQSNTPSENSSSDSEASRRGRRKIARISTEADEAPELTQRIPSPYAFARDPPKPSNRHSGEYLLSPESITSPKTSHRHETRADHSHAAPKSTPNRPQIFRTASTGQVFSEPNGIARSDNIVGEPASNAKEASQVRDKAQSSRYSFTKADLEKREPRVKFSEGDDSESQTLKFDPKDRPSSIRRLTDTAATLPRVNLEMKKSKPSPLQTPLASDREVKKARPSPLRTSFADDLDETLRGRVGDNHDPLRIAEIKHQDFRGVSPATPRGAPLTPPASPRPRELSYPIENSTRPLRSRPPTANNPVYSATPSSLPTIHDAPAVNQSPAKAHNPSDRYGSHPQPTEDRARTQLRLSSSIRSDSSPPIPSAGATGPSPKKSTNVSIVLPYPEDNIPMMPNYEDHVYSPSASKPSAPLPVTRSRSPTLPSDHSETSRSSKDGPARPRLHARHHTYAEGIPQSKDSSTRSVSDNTGKSSPVDKPLLHVCPRSEYSVKYNDWFTLEHYQDIDICADCLEAVFLPSKFGKFFKRAPARRLGKPRKCDFSSPWMRLAWLLTLKEKRDDLKLFIALVDVAMVEKPCPGDKEEKRSWYSVYDESRNHVPGFHACSNCVSNVEALLPSLEGSFTRIHQPEPRQPHTCDLQPKNKAFASYLDALIEIDTLARLHRRPPDLRHFVTLIRKNKQKSLPICARDNLMVQQRWYFIPQLPELTACESCFEVVVYPAIKAGHPIADKFNPKMQLVRESSLGTSCQLYSPRMRDVWRRATERDDWSLLAREARERKATEMHLQSRHKALRNQADDMRRWSPRSQSKDELHKVDREVEKIAEEWKHWE